MYYEVQILEVSLEIKIALLYGVPFQDLTILKVGKGRARSAAHKAVILKSVRFSIGCPFCLKRHGVPRIAGFSCITQKRSVFNP